MAEEFAELTRLSLPIEEKPMPPPYRVADLCNVATSAYRAMTGFGAPQTCYDLAFYSAWICEVPKADTLLVVDPLADTRGGNGGRFELIPSQAQRFAQEARR